MASAIDYGIDAPEMVKNLYWRAGTFAVLGAGIYMMNRKELPGPSLTLMAVLVLVGVACLGIAWYMRWSSQVGKLQMREDVLNKVQWTGDEKVLDVGCGRGLLLIGAAKKLKKGRATGIDVWDPHSLSGNKLEETVANAKAEGVQDRVKVENGDVMQLTYPDNSFDVVLSSTTLHELHDPSDRSKALREMLRVAKPGGQLAIFDVLKAGEYAGVLRDNGAEQVDDSTRTWLWLVPGRIVTARKRS